MFYVAASLDHPGYVGTAIELVQQEIIDTINLASKMKNCYIYIKTYITQILWFTPSRRVSRQTPAKKQLKEHDYYKVEHTPGIFTPKTTIY